MKKIIIILVGIVLITIAFYQYNQKDGLAKNDKVYVEDFKGKNDTNKIQSAINKAESSKIKTVLLDDKKYKITSPIVVKQGVKLLFGYGTQFVVEGNFKVLELEKNASIEGAYIAIDDPTFNSEVIYLDGKNKYYNTWHKTQVKDINIINWTETNKGTGISLYSGGQENEISFINFENIKVVGMETGVKLVAKKPQSGHAWINANRFMNFSLEDCVNMIYMDSNVTTPNEISGNLFTNLQIQPTNKTKSIAKVSGQHNEFHGMVWDLQKINHENELVELTDKSMNTVIEMSSVPANRILDSGKSNIVK
ncbi:pectate lyase superfamily protein [Bacillus thuringiensis]|nr:pectate lyase superfamily protein [Bacillus thuringiensis]